MHISSYVHTHTHHASCPCIMLSLTIEQPSCDHHVQYWSNDNHRSPSDVPHQWLEVVHTRASFRPAWQRTRPIPRRQSGTASMKVWERLWQTPYGRCPTHGPTGRQYVLLMVALPCLTHCQFIAPSQQCSLNVQLGRQQGCCRQHYTHCFVYKNDDQISNCEGGKSSHWWKKKGIYSTQTQWTHTINQRHTASYTS